MRKLFGILLIAIGLLILIGIVVRVVPFPNQLMAKTIPLDDTKDIMVTMNSENVQVIPAHRNNIKIALQKKRLQNIQITSNKKSDGLSISVKDRGWDWFFNWGAKIKIFVPVDYAEDMTVKINSGNFAYEGNSTELKRLDLEIRSGNAQIKNIQVNRLSGDFHSGNFRMEDVKAVTQADIKVRSGNVAISHFSGPLSIDTMSGNVNVEFESLEKAVTINTKSGNVVLNLPNNAGFRIKAQMKSGNIRNSLSLHDSMGGNNYLLGTHGDGKALVSITGWSGNVKIY